MLEHQMISNETYESMKSWSRWYQYVSDTKIQYEPIDDLKGLITLSTENQEPHFRKVFFRFLFFDIFAWLFVAWTLVLGVHLHGVQLNISYFSLAKPFAIRKQYQIQVPHKLPQRCILTNHHRYSTIDAELYSMFFLGHSYRHFYVYQNTTRPWMDYFFKCVYGGRSIDTSYTILRESLETTPHDQSLMSVLFPDKDGQLEDNDSEIAFGIGAYVLSLAYKVPIVDLVTKVDLSVPDAPVEVFVYDDTDLLETYQDVPRFNPKFYGTSDSSKQAFDEYRRSILGYAVEYSCRAKDRFLHRAYEERPVCWIRDGLYENRKRRNLSHRSRYSCPGHLDINKDGRRL